MLFWWFTPTLLHLTYFLVSLDDWIFKLITFQSSSTAGHSRVAALYCFHFHHFKIFVNLIDKA